MGLHSSEDRKLKQKCMFEQAQGHKAFARLVNSPGTTHRPVAGDVMAIQ